jgi:hypothetical protein
MHCVFLELSEMYSGMVVVRLHVGKNLKAIDVGGKKI